MIRRTGDRPLFLLSQFILSINQKNSSKKRVTYTRFLVIINKNMYLLLQVQIMGQSICYNIHRIKKVYLKFGGITMPDNKKEQEREELHRAIWAIADDLRGSVDGWDFKSYVLGIMFYRYISENLTNYINADEIAAGNADFDYAKLSDEEAEQARDDLVKTKGFSLFCRLNCSSMSAPVRRRMITST